MTRFGCASLIFWLFFFGTSEQNRNTGGCSVQLLTVEGLHVSSMTEGSGVVSGMECLLLTLVTLPAMTALGQR